VLPTTDGRTSWSGPIDDDTTVLLSAAHSDAWHLEVDGSGVDDIEPFGWSNGYEVVDGGDATLSFHTSPLRYAVLAVQALVWLWVLRMVVRRRFDAPRTPEEERS
jgi:hypothetical protein